MPIPWGCFSRVQPRRPRRPRAAYEPFGGDKSYCSDWRVWSCMYIDRIWYMLCIVYIYILMIICVFRNIYIHIYIYLHTCIFLSVYILLSLGGVGVSSKLEDLSQQLFHSGLRGLSLEIVSQNGPSNPLESLEMILFRKLMASPEGFVWGNR